MWLLFVVLKEWPFRPWAGNPTPFRQLSKEVPVYFPTMASALPPALEKKASNRPTNPPASQPFSQHPRKKLKGGGGVLPLLSYSQWRVQRSADFSPPHNYSPRDSGDPSCGYISYKCCRRRRNSHAGRERQSLSRRLDISLNIILLKKRIFLLNEWMKEICETYTLFILTFLQLS